MNQSVKNISEGKNHKAINIGSLSNINEYSFLHPKLGHTVESKLFTGEVLGATGAEISFMLLPSQTLVNFLHKHHTHEEIYVFLKGFGKFQVDQDSFDIKEGSLVCVKPDGNRTLRNEAEEPMLYMVIQAKAGTLQGFNISDGYREGGEILI